MLRLTFFEQVTVSVDDKSEESTDELLSGGEAFPPLDVSSLFFCFLLVMEMIAGKTLELR